MSDVSPVPRNGVPPRSKYWRTLSRRQYVHLASDPDFAVYSNPPAGEVVSVRGADGTQIHAEVFGAPNAPPIVLAHGITCAIPFWIHQISALSGEFRVIAYDHRGHGRSEAPRERTAYSLDHLGDDLEAVLQATVRPGERAVLAGHSLGGFVIASWAHRHPRSVEERIGAVVLMNTATGELIRHTRLVRTPRSLNKLRVRLAMAAAPVAGIPIPVRAPLRRQVTARIAVAKGTPVSTVTHLQEMLFTTSSRGRSGCAAALLALGSDHLSLAELTVPTTVVASSGDLLTPVCHAEAMAAELPHLGNLVVTPGGHCSPLEQPQTINKVLRDIGREHAIAQLI